MMRYFSLGKPIYATAQSEKKLSPDRRLDLDLDLGQPTTNLLTTILNAFAVFGLGILWTKEITNAIGSPILAPVILPPLMLITALLLFLPQIRLIAETAFKDLNLNSNSN